MKIAAAICAGCLFCGVSLFGQGLPTVSIYSYSVPASPGTTGYGPNGNLLSYSDSVNGSWSMQYDSLNRIQSANGTAGAYQGLALGWDYDSFGNRLDQTVSGTPLASVVQSSSASYNQNNQMTGRVVAGTDVAGIAYDAAGNTSYDGINYYLYDAEGRVCAVLGLNSAITQYFYDAEGTRVAKANAGSFTCSLTTSAPSATYVLGPSGEQMTEFDQTGAWKHTNIYADGKLLATYDTAGLHFPLSDPLGTVRVQASGLGAAEESFTSLPFGDGMTTTSMLLNPSVQDATEHHFTGKERDTESGNDYFGARYYASTMGRMMSPDPSGLYFANQLNPQSLNLYAYVLNNPMIHTDPDGLECVWDDGSYDSNDDSDTGDKAVDKHGNHTGCSGKGGTWIDHSYFADNNMADWSSKPNQDLADMTVPSATVTATTTPLSGTFSFDMTKQQFIDMMAKANIVPTPWDDRMYSVLHFGHPGTNLRGNNSWCSVHATIAPGAGENGKPVTGDFHIDEFQPFKSSNLTGGPDDGGYIPNMPLHATRDVIPDLLIKAGVMSWTGNQDCPTTP